MLGNDEPPVFDVVHADATSPFLLTADHAGRVIPKSSAISG